MTTIIGGTGPALTPDPVAALDELALPTLAEVVEAAEESVGQVLEQGGIDAALVEDEIWELGRTFLRADGSVRHFSVFSWLADLHEKSGAVDRDAIGTRGSDWLLAQKLGETLQDSVKAVTFAASAEKSLHDAAMIFNLAQLMMLWRTNDQRHFDELMSELKTGAAEGQGLD